MSVLQKLRAIVGSAPVSIDDAAEMVKARQAMIELESSQRPLREKLDSPYPFTGPLRVERKPHAGRRVDLSK